MRPTSVHSSRIVILPALCLLSTLFLCHMAFAIDRQSSGAINAIYSRAVRLYKEGRIEQAKQEYAQIEAYLDPADKRRDQAVQWGLSQRPSENVAPAQSVETQPPAQSIAVPKRLDVLETVINSNMDNNSLNLGATAKTSLNSDTQALETIESSSAVISAQAQEIERSAKSSILTDDHRQSLIQRLNFAVERLRVFDYEKAQKTFLGLQDNPALDISVRSAINKWLSAYDEMDAQTQKAQSLERSLVSVNAPAQLEELIDMTAKKAKEKASELQINTQYLESSLEDRKVWVTFTYGDGKRFYDQGKPCEALAEWLRITGYIQDGARYEAMIRSALEFCPEVDKNLKPDTGVSRVSAPKEFDKIITQSVNRIKAHE